MASSDTATALLVIDVVNPYDFDDADKLIASARRAVPNIADLVQRARDEDVPVVYVNDNYGDWRESALPDLVEKVLLGEHADLVEPVAPGRDANVVLKARHSVFYETPLEYMLRQHDVDRLVMTGQVTEQCILYSALDAYIRHFKVAVPTDAVAHIHEDLAQAAFKMMEVNMGVELGRAAECRL